MSTNELRIILLYTAVVCGTMVRTPYEYEDTRTYGSTAYSRTALYRACFGTVCVLPLACVSVAKGENP
jgi:hypothetical protein